MNVVDLIDTLKGKGYSAKNPDRGLTMVEKTSVHLVAT